MSHQLAEIDMLQGDYARARAEFTAVLELRRQLDDRHGEGRALDALKELP